MRRAWRWFLIVVGAGMVVVGLYELIMGVAEPIVFENIVKGRISGFAARAEGGLLAAWGLVNLVLAWRWSPDDEPPPDI